MASEVGNTRKTFQVKFKINLADSNVCGMSALSLVLLLRERKGIEF